MDKKLTFFEFQQNNSGGRFEVNRLLCHTIIIEADNAEEANDIALELGCYFDGCSKGMDCNCCGDRWYEADDFDKIEKTKKEIIKYQEEISDELGWTTPDARIFFKDGEVIEIFSKRNMEVDS